MLMFFCLSYAGRPTAASTATGSKVRHDQELEKLLNEAFTIAE